MRLKRRNHRRGLIGGGVVLLFFVLIGVIANSPGSVTTCAGGGVFFGVMMYLWLSAPTEGEVLSACRAFARTTEPAFSDEKHILGFQNESGLLLDEERSLVMIFESEGRRCGIYPESALRGAEVVEDGTTVSSTKSGLTSAVVGGLALGGLGLVTGAMLGKRTTKSKTDLSEIVLKIQVSDRANPVYRLSLFKTAKPIDRSSDRAKQAIRKAEGVMALLETIVHQSGPR